MKKKKEVVASSASQHTDKSYVRMEKQAGWPGVPTILTIYSSTRFVEYIL